MALIVAGPRSYGKCRLMEQDAKSQNSPCWSWARGQTGNSRLNSSVTVIVCLLMLPLCAFGQLPTPTYGWNLGDTMEPPCGVGCWSPLPTPALINAVANAGFNAIRIPCAWDSNPNQTNYQISATYMAQVKQVVDWSIAAGMYVVINDHWDDGWLENNITTNVNPTINAKMNSYWTQIATTFAGYDNHLLFAAANEPNVNNTAEEVTLMYYYQTFVNAVRGTGGNNTNRWLVIQSVSDPTWMNALPTDTVSNRIMVEYHNYTPSLFTIFHTDQTWGNAIYFWGPAYHYRGDASRNATRGEEGCP